MDWQSTETVPSKVADGVVYTLNRMTEGRRIELRSQIVGPEDRKREIMREATALGLLDQNGDESKVSAEKLAEREDLLIRLERIQSDEIEPAYVCWGLQSIEGLTIDGEEATPEKLFTDGPPELYNEVAAIIRERVEVSPEDFPESVSRSTSEPQEGGRTNPTTAPPVNGKATTSAETVTSISPTQ